MREVLRRIAIHGGLTAAVLAIIGFMFAELATIWLAGSPGIRTTTGKPVAGTDVDGTVSSRLRSRVPILMAAWGFAFIAVGELVMHWWRGRRKPVAAKPPEPDPAEKLLEELLAQVEARQSEARDQKPEVIDQRSEVSDQPPTAPGNPTQSNSASPTS